MKKDVKKEDLSKKTNLPITKKIYKKIINKFIDMIFNSIDKHHINNNELDYFIVKKDKYFIYEDSEKCLVYRPKEK